MGVLLPTRFVALYIGQTLKDLFPRYWKRKERVSAEEEEGTQRKQGHLIMEGASLLSDMHTECRFISDTLHCVSSLLYDRGIHVVPATDFYFGKGRKCGAMS